MKTCSRCGVTKPLSDFRSRMRRGKEVPEAMCRDCSRAYQREWLAANPDKRREYKQRHRESHRDEINAYKREVYRRDPEKALQANRSWRERNPDWATFYNRHPQRRAARLRRTHGISLEQYAEIWERQDGRCPICLRELPREFLSRDDWKDVPVRPHIDHCHATDVIRGMLCSTCNQGIGLLREDPEMFARAAAYLAGQFPTITPDRTMGVRNGKKTHCVNGHEFTPENTRRTGGRRACRACERESYQANPKPFSCPDCGAPTSKRDARCRSCALRKWHAEKKAGLRA